MKKVKVSAKVLAMQANTNLRDRAMERLQARLKAAIAAGNMDEAELLQRSINNRENNPITHRLEISITPSVLEAIEETEKLERDERFGGGSASFGVVRTNQVTDKDGNSKNVPVSVVIDLTQGAVYQLSKSCGIPIGALPAYCMGATYSETAILREIGDIVPDTSSEGRRLGQTIEIRQGSVVHQDQAIELDPYLLEEARKELLYVEAKLEREAQAKHARHVNPSLATSAKVDPATADTYVPPARKQGESQKVYAKRVEDDKTAWALEHGIDPDEVIAEIGQPDKGAAETNEDAGETVTAGKK